MVVAHRLLAIHPSRFGVRVDVGEDDRDYRHRDLLLAMRRRFTPRRMGPSARRITDATGRCILGRNTETTPSEGLG